MFEETEGKSIVTLVPAISRKGTQKEKEKGVEKEVQ